MLNSYKIIIGPHTQEKLIDWKELWRYRELFYILTWRNIKIRYKQTFLGVVWVLFQPLMSTLIFTVFFGKLAKIPSYDIPYSLFVLCGLVFWIFFSSAVTQDSTSMVTNEGIIKKVYFPRIILPLSFVITSFVDFLINLIMLIVYSLILGYIPSIGIFVVIPLGILITFLTASGLGFLLSAIYVKYRDIGYILPFFIQLLLFLSPVIYPLAIVSDTNKKIMAINPMTSVIESVRMVFSRKEFLSINIILISVISCLTVFFIGLWYFKRTEKFFADII